MGINQRNHGKDAIRLLANVRSEVEFISGSAALTIHPPDIPGANFDCLEDGAMTFLVTENLLDRRDFGNNVPSPNGYILTLPFSKWIALHWHCRLHADAAGLWINIPDVVSQISLHALNPAAPINT
jgi:hypothetical protein